MPIQSSCETAVVQTIARSGRPRGLTRRFAAAIYLQNSPNAVRAFSSEVETGSREENASKQESRVPFRCNRKGKGSSIRRNARCYP
ncbi:MAG: hypothetical protein C0480_02075 [Bradyrhizobium sp.]|nr:hypothetical protein [Bradyrhizobium sp.]